MWFIRTYPEMALMPFPRIQSARPLKKKVIKDKKTNCKRYAFSSVP
jgi:hypothetical protein